MEVSVETCWKSLNKIHEELCGDKVEILKTEDSDVVILADGMGSGVKLSLIHISEPTRHVTLSRMPSSA